MWNNGYQLFGIGYHFNKFRSQVATRKKKLILRPEEELLFEITSNLNERSTINKLKLPVHHIIYMRYFIHRCKLNNKHIDLYNFVMQYNKETYS